MTISEAAAASGVSAKMIRYYEAIGLIGRVERNGANYRSYTEAEVQVLRFVRQARDLGFSVPQMRELLLLWREGGRSGSDVKRIALEHAAALERKAAEIVAMSRALQDIAANFEGTAQPERAVLNQMAAGAAH